MNRRILRNILLISLLLLTPIAGYAVEIEYGLPDSLQDLIFWDSQGSFVGSPAKASESSIPIIVVTPENSQVDSLVVYAVDVTLPDVGIPKLGGLAFSFPAGFGLNQIVDIEYFDNYPGLDLSIRRAYISDNVIVIFFKWDLSPPSGTVVTLTFYSIRNPIVSGAYQIAGLIFNKWFRVESGPSFSQEFEIVPDEPISLAINPAGPLTLTAGSSQLFEASGVDRFGNEIPNLDVNWSLSPEYDSIGIVSEGELYATTVGVGKVAASYDGLSAESGLITVLPGEPGSLLLDVQPSQFVDNPMVGQATITALDLFGNIKTDFDASLFPVSLSVNRGELTPGVLNKADDFVDGVADLAESNIVYEGEAGAVVLSASSGLINSNTVEINYNSITLRPRLALPTEIEIGPKLGFPAVALNPGDRKPIEPVIYTSYFASCIDPCTHTRLLAAISPGDSALFTAIVFTENLQPGDHDTLILSIEAQYILGGDTILTRHMIYQPVVVLPPIEFQYVDNSLSIDKILSPSIIPEITVQLSNSEISVPPDAKAKAYLFIDVGDDRWLQLHPTGGGFSSADSIFTFQFHDVHIPDLEQISDITEGYRMMRFEGRIYVDTGQDIVITALDDFDSVFVSFPSVISYSQNSLSPAIVPAGDGRAFEFDITLQGSTTIWLDPCLSRFELFYNDSKITDACLLDSLRLLPGSNKVSTHQIFIPDSLADMDLTPRLILSGLELYFPRTDTVMFGDETIHVSHEPGIKISSTDLITLNPPFVNHGQQFSVGVSIGNLSGADVDDVSLFIQSEDGSQTFAEVHNLVILAASTLDTVLNLMAPETSIPSVIYKAILSAPGTAVLPPDDNTFAVTVQSPAEIELSADLHGASGDMVDFGQPFSVEIRLSNLGEAGTGPGEVSLLTGGVDFGVPDSSAIILPVDSLGEFQLIAPSVSLSTDLVVKLTGRPIDRNTGQPALVKVGDDTIPVVVYSGYGELVVDGTVSQTPLIVEGTVRNLFSLELLNSTENPLNAIDLKSITIQMADRNGRLISPDLVLSVSESGFLSGGELVTIGEIRDDRLKLQFENYHLNPGVIDTIVFRARFSDHLSVKSFVLNVDGRDISAVFLSGPRANLPVHVKGKFEEVFHLSANFVTTVPTLEKSLMAKNNPFNPEEGPLEIGYILEEDTDIEITIYTLTGEKVLELSIPAGANGARQGQNFISWDGSNDSDRMILNGVYILVIKPGNSSRSVRLKVAVMK